MNKAVFGCYMDYDEEETLARINLIEDGGLEVPVNVSLDDESDMDIENGERCEAELWSNEYEVSFYPSEEAYYKADTSQMAAISMIPMGTFPASSEEEKDYKQNAMILFTGIVREVAVNPNRETDEPKYWLRIETFALTFDLYYYGTETVEPGFLVHGEVWLYGQINRACDHEQESS